MDRFSSESEKHGREQVGYGDILPVTHDERMANCIAALIGGIVFAFCLGILQSLKFR